MQVFVILHMIRETIFAKSLHRMLLLLQSHDIVHAIPVYAIPTHAILSHECLSGARALVASVISERVVVTLAVWSLITIPISLPVLDLHIRNTTLPASFNATATWAATIAAYV